LALEWAHVNLKHRFLVVTQTLSEVRGQLVFGEPKTETARRRVDLPASLVADLEQHREQFSSDRIELVFTSAEGLPVRRGDFRRRYWLLAVSASA
jgi:integrase